MISVPRNELQKFVTVARRACEISRGGAGPPVTLKQKADGLRLSCVTPAAAVELCVDAAGSVESISLPFSALKQCAGSSQQPVEFLVENRRVIADWQERGRARSVFFDAISGDSFPRLPKNFRT